MAWKMVRNFKICPPFFSCSSLRLSFFLLCCSTCFASIQGSRTASCGQVNQKYLYVSPGGSVALPAIVLLHGAGDQPGNMIDAWKKFAAKQGIVLLAPELPRDPRYEDLAPGILRCVAEDAKSITHIDPQHVYLFGNSMGGYLALDGAMFESEYFAAIAIHANRIADDYVGIVKHATRKTPIAIYKGDHDQFFTEKEVRKTRDLLVREGFPVHYVKLDNHDHNYYALSDEINKDAWKFLKEQSLRHDEAVSVQFFFRIPSSTSIFPSMGPVFR